MKQNRVYRTTWARNKAAKLREEGRCYRCTATLTDRPSGLCIICRGLKMGYQKNAQKRWRQKHADSRTCLSCSGPLGEKKNGRCVECLALARGKEHAARLARRKKTADRVFEGYGGYVCACCGETGRLFLSIDHVNNDGAQHRKTVGNSDQFYLWLLRNNFPDGFQVLCMNCNWGKNRNGGVCPHRTAVTCAN